MASERRAHAHLRVYTRDGFPLAVQRFDPPGHVRAAAVIACATGVWARFYHDLARWLSLQGVATCTFDYRYSGISFPPQYDAASFTDEERHEAMLTAPRDINLTDTWGRQDLAAVIRYTSDSWPTVPLTVMGNSLGALLMTLVPAEWHRIARFLNVNGGNAFYGNTTDPASARYSVDTVLRRHLEADGLFRASELGLGYDIPYGPGSQWMEWFMHPHFSAARKIDADILRRMHLPYLYIGFEDDDVLNKRMLERQLGLFSHSDGLKTSLWIDPKTQSPPWPPCGHVASFMPGPTRKNQSVRTRSDTIWPVYLRWIVRGEVDESLGEFRRWTAADELDVEAERVAHERSERSRGASVRHAGAVRNQGLWRAGKARSARL